LDNEIRNDVESFRANIGEVARRRDLQTATMRGAELNRIVSRLDRRSSEMSESQRVLLEVVHGHLREMMDCPRRMRVDDTWPDDFVAAARRAVEAVRSLSELA
jgi:hypothetical protein